MKLTVLTAIHSLPEVELGSENRPLPVKLDYSRTAMSILISILSLVALLGLYEVWASEDATSLGGGLALIAFGTYGLISFLKEKANLDLLANAFDDLPSDAKANIIAIIAKSNSSSSSRLVGLIERLLGGN